MWRTNFYAMEAAKTCEWDIGTAGSNGDGCRNWDGRCRSGDCTSNSEQGDGPPSSCLRRLRQSRILLEAVLPPPRPPWWSRVWASCKTFFTRTLREGV